MTAARRRLVALGFGLALVLVLTAVRIADPYPTQVLRQITFDTFQRAFPRAPVELPVRIVDIDDATLAEIGQWPWPRDKIAELADRLAQMGAAAIAFDVLFPEPDRLSPRRIARALPELAAGGIDPESLPDNDARLAETIARTPTVLGFAVAPRAGALPDQPKAGFALVGGDPLGAVPRMPGAVMSLPEFNAAALGLGSISLDPGGTVDSVRRLPLLWSNGEALFPSLALEALRVATGEGTYVVFGAEGPGKAVEAIRLGGFEVPTTGDGALWLYYQPTPDNLYVSARDVLGDDPSAVAPLIAGNIVFIGTSATGLLDIRGTPLGINMPGVEIHVQSLQQILTGKFLTRADWVLGLEILVALVIGLIVVLTVPLTGPFVGLAVGGVLAASIAASSVIAFNRSGLLIDPSYTLISGILVYTAMVFFQFLIADADKRKIRGAFANYVAPTLLEEIEKSSDDLRLGGENRELTILFCDIRNFTTLSEQTTPEQLVDILNTLFSALGREITDQLGTIDKFMGDAIMAFWNAPVDVPGHPRRACIAALAMRERLDELNAADAFGLRGGDSQFDTIAIGVGMATGEALVGNMGLETRFDYSCVGDPVNTASRIEGACKAVGYGILVSGETRAQASDLAFLPAGAIALKGKAEREPIFAVVGDATLAESDRFKALAQAHDEAIAALAAGADPAPAIARCLTLAEGDSTGLAQFYALLPGRAEDFRGTLAAAAEAG